MSDSGYRNAIHRTVDAADLRPVTHRHAKCKNCDHQFRYHRTAAENDRGTRPECPECEEQGIGGPFGRVSPAEYLAIALAAADGTPYTYGDWLAGDAVVHVDLRDPQNEYLYVIRREYLPCAITDAISQREGGERGSLKTSRSGSWRPEVYHRWMANDVEVELVGEDELPEEVADERR